MPKPKAPNNPRAQGRPFINVARNYPVYPEAGGVGVQPFDVTVRGSVNSELKWTPGHYLQIPGRNDATPWSQSLRFSTYDSQISSNSNIVGACVPVRWVELEPVKNDYSAGIALITAEVNKLQSYSTKKALWLRFNEKWFGGAPASSFLPSYILNDSEYDGGWFDTTAGGTLKTWNSAVTDRLILLFQAIASAFDDVEGFEGLYLSRESATTDGTVDNDPTYSANASVQEYTRLASAGASAFTNSLCIFPLNNLRGSDNQDWIDLGAHMFGTLGLGMGGPDLKPVNPTPGSQAYIGAIGGTDYRGVVPCCMSTEDSNYNGSVGSETVESAYEYAYNTLRASHIFWNYGSYWATPPPYGETSMLSFINTSPPLVTVDPRV